MGDYSERAEIMKEELSMLLDEFIKDSERDKYNRELAGEKLLDAELKLAVSERRKKREELKDMVYSDIVKEDVYSGIFHDESYIYELKDTVPIMRLNLNPKEELNHFFNEWKLRDERANFYEKYLDSIELFEFHDPNKYKIDTWLLHFKNLGEVMILAWDGYGYYDPFFVLYDDIDFEKVGDKLELILVGMI